MEKFTIEFSNRMWTMINRGAAREGYKVANYIRNALALFELITKDLRAGTELNLAIVDKDQKITKLIVLPKE